MNADTFFSFFEQHTQGVLLFLFVLFCLVLMIAWLANIFRVGRYSARNSRNLGTRERLGFVIARFFANIIDDFRHFLALMLVIIFTILIIYSMAAAGTFEEKMKALQLVIASIGTLLGSIIGYYFGESAASKSNNGGGSASVENNQDGIPIEQESYYTGVEREINPGPGTEPIRPVTPPDHLIPRED